jgi:hypothetical protein
MSGRTRNPPRNAYIADRIKTGRRRCMFHLRGAVLWLNRLQNHL